MFCIMISVILSLCAGKPEKLNIGVNIFADFDSVIARDRILVPQPKRETTIFDRRLSFLFVLFTLL